MTLQQPRNRVITAFQIPRIKRRFWKNKVMHRGHRTKMALVYSIAAASHRKPRGNKILREREFPPRVMYWTRTINNLNKEISKDAKSQNLYTMHLFALENVPYLTREYSKEKKDIESRKQEIYHRREWENSKLMTKDDNPDQGDWKNYQFMLE